MPSILLLAATLVVTGATAACGPGRAAPPLSADDAGAVAAPPPAAISPELALAVFDSAWSRVHHSYYDTTFGGLDWTAVRDQLRPAARGAGTVDSLRVVIEGMLARLGDSHFGIIPADVADALDPDSVDGGGGEPGDVGIELRVVDGRLVVFRVRPDGPGDRAGVEAGWVLEGVDSVAAEELLRVVSRLPSQRRLAEAQVAWAAESRLGGVVGRPVVARFRTAADELVDVRIEPAPVPGTPVRFGNLPTMFANLRYREVPLDGGCAGVIAFDVWMTPILPELEAAFHALRHCDGLILDLRGNPGGVAGMVMSVSGYFLDERRPLGVLITRQSELRLVSMPRRVTAAGDPTRPYDGPLALLVDRQTMSTSEIFAAGLQEAGRARVFGEASGGQALPAMMVRLPNDDVLVHVFANLVTPGGVRVEGRGVVPDHPAPLTRQALLAGRDPALDAAVEWIDSRAGAEAGQPTMENP